MILLLIPVLYCSRNSLERKDSKRNDRNGRKTREAVMNLSF